MGFSWVSHSTLIYPSELILCGCVHSSTRHILLSVVRMFSRLQQSPGKSGPGLSEFSITLKRKVLNFSFLSPGPHIWICIWHFPIQNISLYCENLAMNLFTNMFCKRNWFTSRLWLHLGWRRMRPIVKVFLQLPPTNSHPTQPVSGGSSWSSQLAW